MLKRPISTITYLFTWMLLFTNIQSTAQTLNSPESIDYDPNTGIYYVSNSGANQILALDTLGNLSVFADNVGGSPYGLEVVGDILYVNVGSEVKYYGLANENISGTIEIPNGNFLNGMTHKNEETLYVTDFVNQGIHAIDLSSFEVSLLVETGISANGIVYDEANDRLVVLGFAFGQGIYQYDLANNELSSLITPSTFGLDGIAIDRCGNFYVSEWGNSQVVQYNNDFSESTIFLSGVENPADMDFNAVDDVLALTSTADNTLVFEPTEAAQVSNVEIGECLFDHITGVSFNEATFTVDWNGEGTQWEISAGSFLEFDSDSTGQRDFSITLPADGNPVELTLSDESGTLCGDQVLLQTTEECPWAVGIDQLNANTFQAFPSLIHSKGILTIQSSQAENTFSLFSLHGQKIADIVSEGTETLFSLQTLRLSPGVYFVQEGFSGEMQRIVVFQ